MSVVYGGFRGFRGFRGLGALGFCRLRAGFRVWRGMMKCSKSQAMSSLNDA